MEAPTSPTDVWLSFAGQIDNHLCGRLFQQLAIAVQNRVAHLHLLIQSAGGFVGDGVAIHNVLLNLPIQVTTYNAGAVESIALLPYLAGKIRRVSKNATFMLHKTSCPPLPIGAPAKVLRAKADDSDLHDKNVEETLRGVLKLPDAKWAIHAERDLLISATEAVEYGLAHEVADFKPGFPFIHV